MVGEIESRVKTWRNIILPIATLIIIAAAIVWAISVVGTPETARNRELDKRRISDIQRIRLAIDRYYEDKGELPSRLEELELQKRILQDPETGNLYGYEILNSKNYQLSATFANKATEDSYYSKIWGHPAGVHHFSFSAPEK